MKSVPNASLLANIQALVLDCDGVLTPGDLFYDENGRRLLRFHARDGSALAMMCRSGMPVAVLSGRPVDIAEKRCRELGINEFRGSCRDKAKGLRELCADLNVDPAHTAFVGDDLPDIPAMLTAGLAIAVGDAAPEVKHVAHWVTEKHGGLGAVREVCEEILKARGDWQRWLQKLGL